MGIFDSIKGFFDFGGMTESIEQELPPSRSVVVGNPNHTRLKMKFKDVLVVDDIVRHADAALAVFDEFYTQGFITVHIVHSVAEARRVFAANDIKLVIMDSDLADDSGDGATLAKEFLGKRPGLPILANSSKSNYNQRLLDAGAICAIDKDPKKLSAWLAENG